MSDATDTRENLRPALAVATLLLVANALPLPGGDRPQFGPLGPDKWLHAAGHAWFAFVLADVLDDRRGARSSAVAAAVASVAYGVALESLQRWVPGRRGERADLGGQVVGSVLGAVGWWVGR